MFYGSKCTSCNKVVVPIAGLCARCFADTEPDALPVKDEGILDSFTIVYLPYPGQPASPPYAYGMIKLDGTSNYFMHMVDGIPLEDIKVGMRVRAVWNDDRKGDFYDIKYLRSSQLKPGIEMDRGSWNYSRFPNRFPCRVFIGRRRNRS